EEFEAEVFGERLFTYPMRGPFCETMIYRDTNAFKAWWKKLQIKYYSVLSSDNAFIACQYFTVRGLRTLNGKIVQHQLAQYYMKHPNKEAAPIPSAISYYHFMDESFHFNSSTIIGLDVINSLKEPTMFERMIANMTIAGCQRDHYNFSSVLRGIFWHEPALLRTVYKLLRSPVFSMSHPDAMYMMQQCFTKENEGVHMSFDTHQTALKSYREYVSDLNYVTKANREMRIMGTQTLSKHMAANRRAFARFEKKQMDLLPIITGPKPRLQLEGDLG
ncbi:MAG: P-aminobenzoate N-oxygenase AurF, partial [Bdellovibrionia bacterium]